MTAPTERPPLYRTKIAPRRFRSGGTRICQSSSWNGSPAAAFQRFGDGFKMSTRENQSAGDRGNSRSFKCAAPIASTFERRKKNSKTTQFPIGWDRGTASAGTNHTVTILKLSRPMIAGLRAMRGGPIMSDQNLAASCLRAEVRKEPSWLDAKKSLAEKAGLIYPVEATEENETDWPEPTERGDTYYKFTPDLMDVDWKQLSPNK